METIRELLARLATCTPEELANLRQAITDEFNRLDGEEAVTAEIVSQMQELAEAADAVMTEQGNRETQEAEAQQAREAARERVSALNPPAAGEAEAGAEVEEDEDEEGKGQEVTEQEAEQEAVTAAATPGKRGTVARMAGNRPKPSPEALPDRQRAVLMATGALRGLANGNEPITDPEEFASALTETIERLPRHGAPRGDTIVASARWNYPEDRQLGRDPWANERIFQKVLSPQALVATGGICAPVNVDYSVPVWSIPDRPVRDGLPAFQASRGGVTYVTPPDISQLAGATGIWTEATDLAPGEQTKPVLQIVCGSEVTTLVEAVSTRLQFGNMFGRFAPEQTAANTDLSIAAAARIADNNLLNLLAQVCTQNVSNANQVLGATRDLLVFLDQFLAGHRNVHRLARSQSFTLIAPDWIKDLLRADLTRELAHDNAGSRDQLQLTDAQVDELMSSRGVNVVYHLDGQASGSNGVQNNQFFTMAAANGNIVAFPSTVTLYIYPEGHIQFLDGGRLDLGVVRDSTLDSQNDYELFVETFEGLAFRGYSGGAVQLTLTLCANGASGATAAVSHCA